MPTWVFVLALVFVALILLGVVYQVEKIFDRMNASANEVIEQLDNSLADQRDTATRLAKALDEEQVRSQHVEAQQTKLLKSIRAHDKLVAEALSKAQTRATNALKAGEEAGRAADLGIAAAQDEEP